MEAQSTECKLPTSLLDLLSNTLVLYQTTPHLPIKSLLALGATSKDIRSLIHSTRHVFRHLDLTRVKSAQSHIGSIDHGGEVWRNVQIDENVTEDDFYGGPLRGIFSSLKRRYILKDVQTLVLDGLAVPADLVTEIITSDAFNVRILSIREVQHLNQRKLQQALLYAIRPSRPQGTPKLQGLYIFGPKDSPLVPLIKKEVFKYPAGIAPIDTLPFYRGITSSRGAQIGSEWNKKSQEALDEEAARQSDLWLGKIGNIFPKPALIDWPSTVQACLGHISFDAVLCSSPRHCVSSSNAWYTSPDVHLSPQMGTVALKGCTGCRSAPEGLTKFSSSSMDRLPLLAPVPIHSSTTKVSKRPPQGEIEKVLLVRCIECLKSRYCESCHLWWCEDCYQVPSQTLPALPGGTKTPAGISETVKVLMDLCVDNCLVGEMMSGAGSNGMWG